MASSCRRSVWHISFPIFPDVRLLIRMFDPRPSSSGESVETVATGPSAGRPIHIYLREQDPDIVGGDMLKLFDSSWAFLDFLAGSIAEAEHRLAAADAGSRAHRLAQQDADTAQAKLLALQQHLDYFGSPCHGSELAATRASQCELEHTGMR